MKTIYCLIGVLLSVFTVHSQSCEPIYTFEYGDFACDDEGTFCIVMNRDLNQSCPAQDFIVQLEWPENDILDIDHLDFTQVDPGPPTEIYENEVSWNSGEADTRICFRGWVQDPLVEVTVRFIDRSTTPETLIKEDVFQLLRNMTTVGNGGTVLLSDLVGNELLPASQAANTAQQFIVDGTLVIDQYYTFGFDVLEPNFNEIYFTQGSGMVVETPNVVEFKKAKLSSCDVIWDGLDVESQAIVKVNDFLIENAEKAFEMDELSQVILQDAVIQNNKYGVFCDLPSQNFINLVFITSTDEHGGNLVNISNNENSLFSFSTGLYLRDVNSVTINRWVFFSGMNIGIDAKRTNLYIGRSNRNIRIPDFSELQTGIVVDDAENAWITANFAAIENRGILFSEIENLDISYSMFEFLNSAIEGRTVEPIEHNQIHHNLINLQVNKAFTGVLRPGRGEFEYNNVACSSFNAMLLGLGYGDHRWAVQLNEQMNSETSNNVFLRRTQKARIHENDDVITSSSQNVLVQGGRKNLVGCNVMDNDEGNNIQLNGSPSALVHCNALDANDVNLYVRNNCGQSEIRVFGGSNINSTTYNLEYDDRALTGHQVDMGNKFELSSQGNEKAIHHGDQFLSELSQYIVPIWAFQGDEDFPFFISASSQWFNNTGSIPSECGPSGCLPGFGGNPGEEVPEMDNANALYGYLQSGLPSTYGAEIEFDVEFELMKSLHVLKDNNALSGNLLSYYNSNQTTEAYKLSLVEHNIANSIELTPNDEGLLDSVYSLFDTIQSAMSDIVLYTIDSTTGEVIYDSVAMAEMDSLHLEIDGLNDQLDSIRSPYISAWYSELSNMETYNSNISTTTTSGANLKAMNDVYIRYSLSGEHILNSTDLANVQQAAAMCYLEGGEGVLLARNLEAAHLGYYVDYSDDCNQTGNLVEAPVSTHKFIGIPNPSNGQKVMITSTEKEPESHEIEIIDISGKVMLHTVSEKEIDLSIFPPGVYYVRRVQDEGSQINNGRIVITLK